MTLDTCATCPPGNTYSSMKSPMPLPRLSPPGQLCVMPWLSTSPPGFKIRRILKPGGLVLNHGITHNWPGGDSLGSGIGDFIEEYVFPGGQVAHVSRVIEGLAADGLELLDAEALREHYARTLWHWLDRLEANADAARHEIGEEKFRVWRIYLAGSAHAFDRGWLSIFQLLAGKPLPDGRLPHPA